jgi:hypothetical protein
VPCNVDICDLQKITSSAKFANNSLASNVPLAKADLEIISTRVFSLPGICGETNIESNTVPKDIPNKGYKCLTPRGRITVALLSERTLICLSHS